MLPLPLRWTGLAAALGLAGVPLRADKELGYVHNLTDSYLLFKAAPGKASDPVPVWFDQAPSGSGPLIAYQLTHAKQASGTVSPVMVVAPQADCRVWVDSRKPVTLLVKFAERGTWEDGSGPDATCTVQAKADHAIFALPAQAASADGSTLGLGSTADRINPQAKADPAILNTLVAIPKARSRPTTAAPRR